MPTNYPELFSALSAPFAPDEIKTRSQGGRTFQYITARTVLNRLDEVLGPEHWWDEYVPGEHSVLCKLSLRLPDGSVLTKQDAGGFAGMSDQGDDEKSGFSDALKRAAAKFGIGRFLYGDGIANFHPGAKPARGQWGPSQPQKAQQQQQQGNGQPRQYDGPPRSGKALFAWTKEQEQKYEVGLLKYLNSFMKLQDMPGRMVDLSPEDVAICHAEAERKLQAAVGDRADGEAYHDEPDAGARG